MFKFLVLAFIAMPIVEIFVLLEVSDEIGGWTTIGIIILTAMVGSFLVKQQGMQTYGSAQKKMQSGQLPETELLEGLFILVAGILLLTPGFVTDIFGLVCLIPLTRKLLIHQMLKKVKFQSVHTQFHGQGFHNFTQQHNSNSSQGNIYEGEAVDLDKDSIDNKPIDNKRD